MIINSKSQIYIIREFKSTCRSVTYESPPTLVKDEGSECAGIHLELAELVVVESHGGPLNALGLGELH